MLLALEYWLSVLKMRQNVKSAQEFAMLCSTSRQSFGSLEVTWRCSSRHSWWEAHL